MYNKGKNKTRKGISLIVLVITIIVIIILATTLIVTLVQNSPISSAKEAVNANDLKTAQEAFTTWIGSRWAQNIEEAGAIYNGKITNDISTIIVKTGTIEKNVELTLLNLGLENLDELIVEDSEVVAITKDGKRTEVKNKEYQKAIVGKIVTRNATLTGKEPNYQNPVIPEGFKAVNTPKATWSDSNGDFIVDDFDKGLVIQDSNENEYVWIPVDGVNVKYEKMESSHFDDYSVKIEQVKDDKLPDGVSSENYQIDKYGGFYVARYEASLPDNQQTEELMATKIFSTSENNKIDIGKPQSKKGKIVWDNITYKNAKINAENAISTNYVQSGLITGTQWDTMLKFLSSEVDVDNDSTSWGNYLNSYGYTINGYYKTESGNVVYKKGTYEKTSSSRLYLTTGAYGDAVESGSPKNIYDVAGNIREWCTEIAVKQGGSQTSPGQNICRGGNYYNIGTIGAMYRGSVTGASGFRVVLFIK